MSHSPSTTTVPEGQCFSAWTIKKASSTCTCCCPTCTLVPLPRLASSTTTTTTTASGTYVVAPLLPVSTAASPLPLITYYSSTESPPTCTRGTVSPLFRLTLARPDLDPRPSTAALRESRSQWPSPTTSLSFLRPSSSSSSLSSSYLGKALAPCLCSSMRWSRLIFSSDLALVHHCWLESSLSLSLSPHLRTSVSRSGDAGLHRRRRQPSPSRPSIVLLRFPLLLRPTAFFLLL